MELSSQTTEKERLYIQAQDALYKGGTREFIPLLEKIISKYPKEKEAHYWLGVYISIFAPPDILDMNRGIKELETVLELDPNDKGAYGSLGSIQRRLGNFEKSLEYRKKLASMDPKNGNAFSHIADTYFFWGKLDKAAANSRRAIKLNPNLYLDYWATAYIEALRENYTEALDCLDRLIERSPPTSFQRTAYEMKGFLNFWLGQFDQSLLDFKKREDLGGNASYNDWYRAVIYFAKWDYGNSLDYMEKFLEWAAKSYLANYSKVYRPFFFGMIDLKLGNLESAKARLEEIKSLFQTDERKAFWQNGPFEEAWDKYFLDILGCEIGIFEGKPDIDRILKAFEGDCPFLAQDYQLPNNIDHVIGLHDPPFVRDYIPRAYIQIGELDKAIEAYEKLVTFNPESVDRRLIHPLNYYRLGKVYEQKGNKRKARANYRKLLKLWKDADPGITEVEDANKRLTALK